MNTWDPKNFKIQIKVRYKETDQMGVVHHSNYFTWFEAGRTEYILNAGFSYSSIEARGILLPVIDAYCRYYEGARYEELIDIYTNIKELKYSKSIFEYHVIRETDRKLLAAGHTTHAFVDRNFKPVNAKKMIPDIWNKLKQLKTQL